METLHQAKSLDLLQINARRPTTSLIAHLDTEGFTSQSRFKTLHSQGYLSGFVSWKMCLSQVSRATFNPKIRRSNTEQQELIIKPVFNPFFPLPRPSSILFYHLLHRTKLLVKLSSIRASLRERTASCSL